MAKAQKTGSPLQARFDGKNLRLARGADLAPLVEAAAPFAAGWPRGDDFARRVEKTLTRGPDARALRKLILREAKRAGIAGDAARRQLKTLVADLAESARAGTLIAPYPLLAPPPAAVPTLGVGLIASLGPGSLCVLQGTSVTPLILADAAGQPVGPLANKELQKAILVIDLLLEVLSILALVFNIVLPKIDWGRIADAFLRGRQVVLPNEIIGILAAIMEAVKEQAAEKLLAAAKRLLQFLTGNDSVNDIWSVFKQGLNLPWYEWAKIILVFGLLLALDSLSGGAALAAKITLVLVTLADIFFLKAPKLEELGLR